MGSSAWSNDASTSLTLPTGAIAPENGIYLNGATDTELIYNGGNLIASIAATAGTDGLGNSYPAGISSSGGISTDSTILLYNGTPAFGNLIGSFTGTPGTDIYGNTYSAVFNSGNQQGAHFGVDNQGNVYVVNSSGVLTDFIRASDGFVRFGTATGSNIQVLPTDGAELFYASQTYT
jgi:hypothetical protein